MHLFDRYTNAKLNRFQQYIALLQSNDREVQILKETQHHPSPAGRPMPLAFHEAKLWVGCWETQSLYAIDPTTWSVLEEVPLPGKPFGLASFAGSLRITIGLGENDDRYIYSFQPGTTLGEEEKVACPEFHGSHLIANGDELLLVQQTNRRILSLTAAGSIVREIALPARCAGAFSHDGNFFMIAADEDFDELHFATLDIDADEPSLNILAPISDQARGLTSDGNSWWTSHRELNTIVAFTIAL